MKEEGAIWVVCVFSRRRRHTRGRVFFFKQKAAYEIAVRLVGLEMFISDRFPPPEVGGG